MAEIAVSWAESAGRMHFIFCVDNLVKACVIAVIGERDNICVSLDIQLAYSCQTRVYFLYDEGEQVWGQGPQRRADYLPFGFRLGSSIHYPNWIWLHKHSNEHNCFVYWKHVTGWRTYFLYLRVSSGALSLKSLDLFSPLSNQQWLGGNNPKPLARVLCMAL